MSKQNVPNLKDLFKQAAEIAQQVPENMQEAAFNRAIDLLTGSTKSEPIVIRQTLKRKGKSESSQQSLTEDNDSPKKDLLSAIDSTKYPAITSNRKTLDRSLLVLQLALKDHGVDGLTSSDIACILTEKFRIKTTNKAISMALNRAANLVDRTRSGSGYSYRIMDPGDKYLENLDDATTSPSPLKRKIKKQNTTQGDSTKKKVKPAKSVGKNKPIKKKVGPKAAVINLVESGFFSIGRTGPEVQAHLESKRGFIFDTSQLRVAMLRLVRDQKLDRDENSEGQYEYKRSES